MSALTLVEQYIAGVDRLMRAYAEEATPEALDAILDELDAIWEQMSLEQRAGAVTTPAAKPA